MEFVWENKKIFEFNFGWFVFDYEFYVVYFLGVIGVMIFFENLVVCLFVVVVEMFLWVVKFNCGIFYGFLGGVWIFWEVDDKF